MRSVTAKPFTVPEPINPKTIAAIRVVTLPSTIADIAFWKPVFSAVLTVFPIGNVHFQLALAECVLGNDSGSEELLFKGDPFQFGGEVLGIGLAFFQVVHLIEVIHKEESGIIALVIVILLHVAQLRLPVKSKIFLVGSHIAAHVDEMHAIIELEVVGFELIEELDVGTAVEGGVCGMGGIGAIVGVHSQGQRRGILLYNQSVLRR